MHDLRFAVRTLWRNPLITGAAVVSLALAIGANTALFTVVNAVLFKPLPVRDPARVVNVYTSYPQGSLYGTTSWPEYLDYRARNQVFAGLIAWSDEPVNLGVNGVVERVLGNLVSANFFRTIGVDPAPGRSFRDEDENQRVCIIGHALWRSKFGGGDIIGREIQINDQSFTIIGVAPQSFWGLDTEGASVWFTPADRSARFASCRECNSLRMAARLKRGVSRQQAESEMRWLASEIEQGPHQGATITIAPGSRVNPAESKQILMLVSLIFAALAIVQMIACANVANLLLTRAAGRTREIGVRVAMGAPRWRLIRQLMAESMVLAGAAGALGLLFSLWTADLIRTIQPPNDNPFAPSLAPDFRVLLFALALSLITGIVFGLVPALQASKPDLIAALRGTGVAPSRSRLGGILVAAQVALSMVLLVSAGLLLRGFQKALTLEPGFAASHVLVIPLDLHLAGYDPARASAFYQQLEELLIATPGIRSASFARTVPVGGQLQSIGISRNAGEPFRMVSFNLVSPSYFRTLAIPLLAGRELSVRDHANTPPVALINETMARQLFAGIDPIGQTFSIDNTRIQVVGLVKDSRYLRLGETPRPHFYRPLSQQPDAGATLLVNTAGAPLTVLPTVRRKAQALDARLPLLGGTSLAEQVRRSLFDSRIGATLAASFGVVALVLAAVGLYGVVSYNVTRRTHEIGIRMAIGAERSIVLTMVLREGLRRVLVGLILGTIGSAAAGQLLRKFLYGLSPADPIAWIAVALLLASVGLFASWLPARRAARIDPMNALRYN
jgi:predicted permease